MSELETKLLEKIAEIVAAEDLKKVAYAELVSDSEAEDAAEAALAEASEERAASQDVYADADEVFDGKLAELIALADAAKV